MTECYEIRLRGQAGDLITAAFEEMSVSSEPRTTVLRGMIDDQAALHGVLSRCRDLGMEILEVRVVRVYPETEGHEAAAPAAATSRPRHRGDRFGWPQLSLALAALCIVATVLALALAGDDRILVGVLVAALVVIGAFAWRAEARAGHRPG